MADRRKKIGCQENMRFLKEIDTKFYLTITYNPKDNGKNEFGHSLIMKALIKACRDNMSDWPRILRFALWTDQKTHSMVTSTC